MGEGRLDYQEEVNKVGAEESLVMAVVVCDYCGGFELYIVHDV